MQPFTKHTGLVAPLDRVNVDTDQMVPKQFIKWLTREGYGRVLFLDWRYLGDGKTPNPEFVLNAPRYQGASVLVARANFGCGSSREHAAWSLLDYGFRAILAPSFAAIFYNNCFKNGILLVTLDEATIEKYFDQAKRAGFSLEIDLIQQTIRDPDGFVVKFNIDPFRKKTLLEGLDDIELTLKHEEKIRKYEEKLQPIRLIQK